MKKSIPKKIFTMIIAGMILASAATAFIPAMKVNVYAAKKTKASAPAYPAGKDVAPEVMHAYVQQVIAAVTTPDMTNDQKLASCFLFVVNHMSYKRDTAPAAASSIKDYALEAFFTGKGNCYRYASMFAYMAAELGYNVTVHSGECTSDKGGMTPHAWVVINYPDGRSLIYDGSFADTREGAGKYYGITKETHSRVLVTKEIWTVQY